MLWALRRKILDLSKTVQAYAWTRCLIAEIVADLAAYAAAISEEGKNERMRKLVESLEKIGWQDLLLDPRLTEVLRRMPGATYTGGPMEIDGQISWITYFSGTNCFHSMQEATRLLSSTLSDFKRAKTNPLVFIRLAEEHLVKGFTLGRLLSQVVSGDPALSILEQKESRGEITRSEMEEMIRFPGYRPRLGPFASEIWEAVFRDLRRRSAPRR